MKQMKWILTLVVVIAAVMTPMAAHATPPTAAAAFAAMNMDGVGEVSLLDMEKYYAEERTHDADVDQNWALSLSELLRPIQIFNVGSYHPTTEDSSEDGFAPGPRPGSDTTPPVITLNGNSNVTVEACSDYTELGVTATDVVDGSVAVEIYGIVDETMPDIYTITYTAEDSSGNTASVIRTVNIVDTTAPVVTLTGPATADTIQGETYNDPGASATDGCRGFGHITWGTTGFVNTATPGVYVLTYTATDDFGNDASVSRTVTVVEAGEGELDTEAPVITLNGNTNITIEACSNYTELGATAIDEVDGSVAVELVVEGDVVDEYVPGTYTVNYTSHDSAGNTATATRTVNVVDTTAPTTTLVGPATADTMQGEVYDDPGASATDGCRGFSHITWETTGAVNTATPGVYVLTYTATDDFGNDASVTRTVTVVEVGELEITDQSTGISVPENTPVELTVGATGSNLTFQWEASGTVAAPGIVWEPVTTARWYGVSGMNTATLKFSLAQISSAMWYRCVVSDGTNTVTTKPIWLHVIDVFNGGGTILNAIEIDMEAQGNDLSITVDPPTSNPGQYFFDDNVTRILFEFYFKDRDTVRASVAFDGTNPVNLIVPGILAGTEGILAFEMRGLVNEADDQGWISIGMQSFHILGIVRGDARGNENPDDYHWIFPKGLGKSSMSSILNAFLGIE